MTRELISGGTGSFGNAIVPLLLTQGHTVIVYSRDEQKQEEMRQRIAADMIGELLDNLRFYIGDVRDRERLTFAMKGVDTVIRAAALKIVPKGEIDPSEFISTNIHGSDNVVHAALAVGVQKAVLISTDKAVSPINLYGATKLAAEKLFVAANNYRSADGPIFSVARYGNVAGRAGR
jgi:UDP-N-acetylglucosamine 4,6-dehydratase